MDFALSWFLEIFFVFLSALGHPFFWLLASTALYWKGREKESFFLLNTIVLTGVFVAVFKNFFMIPRPAVLGSSSLLGKLENSFSFSFDKYSFPSGHAATIAAVYGFFREKLSKPAEFFFLALILGVGYSRIFLERHYPVDVVAGILLGLVVGRLVWAFFDKWNARAKKLFVQEELGLVLTSFLLVAVLFLFEELSTSAIIIGYYLGVFLFKFTGHDNRPVGGKPWAKKAIAGFLGILAVLSPIAFGFLPVFWGGFLLFFAGFWLSFLFPVAYEKALKNKTVKNILNAN
ncbi:MAG: phosphatase PAP2 family protein [archaeon]|nr:phosphatase PAP2 family protein [archaeon]